MQEIYDHNKGKYEKKWHAFLRCLMQKLTHTKVNLLFAFLLFLLSLAYCICKLDWQYISRVGSLITVIGLVCMERRNLRLGPDLVFHFNRSALDEEETLYTEQLRTQEINNVYADAQAGYWGFFLISVGTVLWGYGDAIFCILFPF